MAKARRRGSVTVRDTYRAGLVELDSLYGALPGAPFAAQIAEVDAGRKVRCFAYEVDLMPPCQLLEIDADGTLAVVAG